MPTPLIARVAGASLAIAALAACGGGDTAPAQVAEDSTVAALFGAPGVIGDGCVEHDDCQAGVCDLTVPGGYCTSPCETSSDCPDDGYCSLGTCFQRCDSQRDCRTSEFQCFEAEAGVGVCSFDVEAARPAAPNVGAPCRATLECAAPSGLEAFCIAEVDPRGTPTGHRDGMCVAIGCTHDTDCGAGAVCAPGAVAYCVPACRADEDCRYGYHCDASVGGCAP